MFLTKSCKKEHNILNGTIRLGSLYEYRKTEQPEIEDKEEGIFRYSVVIDGVLALPHQLNNALMAGIKLGDGSQFHFPGKYESQYDPYHIESMTEDSVVLRDSKCHITCTELNRLIFCCSLLKDPKECVNIFECYDDFWYAPASEYKNFATTSAECLRQAILEARIEGRDVVPRDLDLRGLSVDVSYSRIQYLFRDLHINKSNINDLPGFLARLGSIPFTKPPIPFLREQEYRFVYTIRVDGKIITPLMNSVIMDSSPLHQYVVKPK